MKTKVFSVLGPLLFLVYINDLIDEVDCGIKFFADDTTLYIIVEDQNIAVDRMNRNLNNIKKWADTWLVKFNPSKTESMTISAKKIVTGTPILYDNTPLKEVRNHKHLGVLFNNKLTWTDHIQALVSKVSKLKDVMLYLKNRLDRNTLDHIYKAFVRPKLEFASIIWADCTKGINIFLKGVNQILQEL